MAPTGNLSLHGNRELRRPVHVQNAWTGLCQFSETGRSTHVPTDNPDGGFFHFLDFFGPGSSGQGLDAWSLYDLLGSDGSTISSNGFNWSLEFSGALLGTDFTKSGIIRHFEIPVGSLVTSQGNAELTVNDLLTSVRSVQNVKDPGGTNFQMKNAIVNHALCTHLNYDFGSWTIGTNYAWEQAIGTLSSEYVSGMIFEAPFTDPSSGTTNVFQLASAAHAVFAFNKIQADPFSQSLRVRQTSGKTAPLSPITKSVNIRPSPTVLESYVRPLSSTKKG